jgi:hypothetical protein
VRVRALELLDHSLLLIHRIVRLHVRRYGFGQVRVARLHRSDTPDGCETRW